jgi:hypothetical protein
MSDELQNIARAAALDVIQHTEVELPILDEEVLIVVLTAAWMHGKTCGLSEAINVPVEQTFEKLRNAR